MRSLAALACKYSLGSATRMARLPDRARGRTPPGRGAGRRRVTVISGSSRSRASQLPRSAPGEPSTVMWLPLFVMVVIGFGKVAAKVV